MTIEGDCLLINKQTQEQVSARYNSPVTQNNLTHYDIDWKREQSLALQNMQKEGIPRDQWPEDIHWDWSSKIKDIQDRLDHTSYALEANNQTQGLMLLKLTQKARLATQLNQHIVYVDYIETAPWNRFDLDFSPQYSGIGTILITLAVQHSIIEEFKGRIGLHSLSQAHDFYKDHCGMTCLGRDADYYNLHYFEFTPEQAKQFIG